jgi:hypothetical protein
MPTPIRFFTIVLNGLPFLRHHLPVFQQLDIDWEWHIAEGVAELRHDTAWSLRKRWSWRRPLRLHTSGRIPAHLHQAGRSVDGTSAYLDAIARSDPRVKIRRKPLGAFWDGKREMVQSVCCGLSAETLLWQVDSDELWTADQITTAHDMFAAQPAKTAAYYWCRYFVGPRLVIASRNGYGNNPQGEWLRTWRARPGDAWQSHEPPRLLRGGEPLCGHAFSHAETEQRGLVFEHYAYATEQQVAFKEAYYGYSRAVRHWRRLQSTTSAVQLGRYLPWVKDATIAQPYDGPVLAHCDAQTGAWSFPGSPAAFRAATQAA